MNVMSPPACAKEGRVCVLKLAILLILKDIKARKRSAPGAKQRAAVRFTAVKATNGETVHDMILIIEFTAVAKCLWCWWKEL
jgi:hypothetical protein